MYRQAKRKHEDISPGDYTICIESADKLAGACRATIGFQLLGNGIEGDEDEFCVPEFPKNFIRGHKNSFKIVEPKVSSFK
jgi:hypothetical protein